MNTDFQNQSVIDLLPNNGAVAPSSYAGFWRRLIAYAIDSLIIGVPLMVIGRMFGWVTLEQTANSAEAYTTSDGFALFAGVVATLYFVLMESSDKQATLGKRRVRSAREQYARRAHQLRSGIHPLFC